MKSKKRVNSKKNQLSHDDIQMALRAFKKHGGLIKQLPDEVTTGGSLVGKKWSMYETGDDVSGDGESGLLN